MNQAESVSKNQNVSKIKSYRSSCLHIHEKGRVGESVVLRILLEDGFLRLDLSRVFSAKNVCFVRLLDKVHYLSQKENSCKK